MSTKKTLYAIFFKNGVSYLVHVFAVCKNRNLLRFNDFVQLVHHQYYHILKSVYCMFYQTLFGLLSLSLTMHIINVFVKSVYWKYFHILLCHNISLLCSFLINWFTIQFPEQICPLVIFMGT